MKVVNLFIVGAAKAGTSSLWSALKQHPDVFSPADELNKEPSFFTPIGNHMGLARYHALYAGAETERYLMDASTSYLTHPGAAAGIHDYNPDAKIIIVLRDPAARAYSLYCWMVAEGYEWASSFEAALALEDQRAETPDDRKSMPQYFWNYMYRRSGLYSKQVKRFEVLFGRNVLLVNFHELVAQTKKQMVRILDFLGLERFDLALERENPSMQVVNPQLSFAARRFQQRLSSRLPKRFRQTKKSRDVLVYLLSTNRPPPPMKLATRVALDAYFAEDLAHLRERHGLRLKQNVKGRKHADVTATADREMP